MGFQLTLWKLSVQGSVQKRLYCKMSERANGTALQRVTAPLKEKGSQTTLEHILQERLP